MTSFLSKLKSTVSEVLPGNPLSSDYDIQDRVVGSAGPDLVWKLYRANKKTTKENATVFVFDKKTIDKHSRDDKKMIIASLKRGIQQLTKLRHPKILSVVHPIEENRDCLAFATEPVLISLANVLEHDTGASETRLDEVEVKYGLIQVLEGLSFIHNDVKLVHGNIHPSSILLSDMKTWKLAGFDFFIANSSSVGDQMQFDAKEWCSGLPKCVQADLNYMAPELGNRGYCDGKSDMYSLGVMVHAIYNQGKPVYQCHDSLASFKSHSAEMRSFRVSLLRNVPTDFHDSFKSLLSYDPSSRPNAKSLLKTSYFEDMHVMTLIYLDSLVQRDNLQKSQFFKNLPKVLKQLPLGLALFKVLPILFSECSNKDMIPFVLQNILVVAERCSKQEYSQHIFNKLVPIFRLSEPIQIPVMLLKNMRLLLSKTSESDTKSYILPMVFKSIEIDNSQLQELCLDILPDFSHLIDKQSMKSSVIPRIRHLCLNTQLLNLRVKCLISIGKMMTHMDKWFVLDEILPFLPTVPSREPTILMAILGIYKIAFTHKDLGIPKEQLATKSVPFLVALSVDHSLSKQQFISYMSVVKNMIASMEKEHLSALTKVEQQDKDESTLKFNGTSSVDDEAMSGFLSEAGLMSGGATKISTTSPTVSQPASSASPVKVTPPPQAKDLTSTLTATSIQPMKVCAPVQDTSLLNSSQPPLLGPPPTFGGSQSKPINWQSPPTNPTGFKNAGINNSSPSRALGSSVLQPSTSIRPASGSSFLSGQTSSGTGMASGAGNSQSMGWSMSSNTARQNAGWSFNSHSSPQPAAFGGLQPQQTLTGAPLLGTSSAANSQGQTTPALSQNDINDLLG